MDVRRLAVGLAVAFSVSAPATAAAQDYPGGTVPPGVLGSQEQRGQGQQGEVLPTQAQRGGVAAVADNRTLPVTGSDLLGLTVLGAGLVGGGVVVVARTRRRPASA